MVSRGKSVNAPPRLRPSGSTFRSILLHVQPEAEARPRLTSAVALARAMDSWLIGVGAEIATPTAMGDPFAINSGELIVELQKQVDAELTSAADLFHAEAVGLKHYWVDASDRPAQAIVKASGASDLIVAGGSPLDRHDANRSCDAAELILQSGRPVLIVPPRGGELKAEAIVVGWTETREARRALADALPLLRCARQVVLVEVKSSRDEAAGDIGAVAAALARHGVNAVAKLVHASSDAVVEELRLEAVGIGADLIVAGGYGHTRLAEWMFGGATFELLRDPDHFVFCSH